MMVEFIEQDSGNQLTVSASEFLKADKNQEEYASLAMATDAYSALFGIEYIIPRNEYDAVKSWLGKTGTVIFQVCDCLLYTSMRLQSWFPPSAVSGLALHPNWLKPSKREWPPMPSPST